MSLTKRIINLVFVIALTTASLYFVLGGTFKYGLDIEGGSKLTYTADVSGVPKEEVADRMDTLKNVIEGRINSLGVSEPSVYTSSSSQLTGLKQEHRLEIELPGVTDINEAIKVIGETPFLEFKIFENEWANTELNGGHINGAEVAFLQGVTGNFTNIPVVNLRFNGEGTKLFADLTRDNVGKMMGIFLDGVLVSDPVIRESIPGGVTQISGAFTLEEARDLSSNLNFGALPLDIELSGTNTVDPSLGKIVLEKSTTSALYSIIFVAILIIFIYRLVGFIATLSLSIYILLMLLVFQTIPIVLTAASLAGFIVSVGLAVDANILIFERLRENIRRGDKLEDAVEDGFKRAWSSIRDSNISSLLIASLLFWMGTSVVKGFAFTFVVGILVSMFTAIVITRTLIRVLTLFIKNGRFNLLI